MFRLPNKPSKLIRLAIKDLEAVEKNPRYTIDMTTWHTPSSGLKGCFVCLAGAVMAQTLRADREGNRLPHDFKKTFGLLPSKNHKRLEALDFFRRGLLYAGLQVLGYPKEVCERFENDAPYNLYTSQEAKQFKDDMLSMADMFEQEGF